MHDEPFDVPSRISRSALSSVREATVSGVLEAMLGGFDGDGRLFGLGNRVSLFYYTYA